MTHELKILPRWFKDVAQGLKNFEIRKNDRDYKVGDILVLKEWDGEHYTGRIAEFRVGYIYYGNGEYGVDEGYCILGVYPYNGKLKTVGEWLDAQPCEDAISREEAFMCLTGENLPEDRDKYIALVNNRIKDLPSVTPIRLKGEWEYDETIQNWRCSKCHETPKTLGYVGTKEFMTEHFKFCNHCGADMRPKDNV